MDQASSPDAKLTAPRALTRREMLAYTQIAALLLLAIAFAVLLAQAVIFRPQWIDLGASDALQSDTPIHRVLTLRDNGLLSVWVVFTEGKWFVFDARVPFGGECFYQWQLVTGRFEDPCSGAKFSITGEFVDPYGGFAGKQVQDLNQYLPEIRDGHIFIDPNRVVHPEPFLAPGLRVLAINLPPG